MKREKFNAFLLGLVAMAAIFGFVSVAFAAFSTTLKINGSATVAASSWDIHFDNISAARMGNTYDEAASRTPDTTGIVATVPTYVANTQQRELENYSVTLAKPGDYVEFDVDIVNAGTFNASLASIAGGALSCTAGASTTDAAGDRSVCSKLSLTFKEKVSGATFNTGSTLSKASLSPANVKTITIRLSLWESGFTNSETFKVTDAVTVDISEIAFVYNQAA